MERSIEELSAYRFFKVKEDFATSKMLLESIIYWYKLYVIIILIGEYKNHVI